jgi:hypothetical protein
LILSTTFKRQGAPAEYLSHNVGSGMFVTGLKLSWSATVVLTAASGVCVLKWKRKNMELIVKSRIISCISVFKST